MCSKMIDGFVFLQWGALVISISVDVLSSSEGILEILNLFDGS